MKKTFAVIAALGLALPVAPLAAQQQSVTVEYEDLDLSTPEGQQTLDMRINDAARAVCGADQQMSGTRIRDRQTRTCVANAKKQVKSQIAARIGDSQLGG